jgi:hypothetical protein
MKTTSIFVALLLLLGMYQRAQAQSSQLRIQFDTVYVNNEPAARVMIGEVTGRLVQIETYLMANFSAKRFQWHKAAYESQLIQNIRERKLFPGLFPGARLQFVYKDYHQMSNFEQTDSDQQIPGIQGSEGESTRRRLHPGAYLARAGRSYNVALVTSIITSAVATLILPPYGLGVTLGVLGAGSGISTAAFISGNADLVKAGEGLKLQSNGTP